MNKNLDLATRPDLEALPVSDLLLTYAAVMDELRRREIVRSSNSPLSDYAELLFCNAFGWDREQNSKAGHDATDASDVRYQIKARRLTRHNKSRQMSAIRNIDATPFDQLAALLVDESFTVIRAVIVPIAIVQTWSKHVDHTNSRRFLLRDEICNLPEVKDVTDEIRAAAKLI